MLPSCDRVTGGRGRAQAHLRDGRRGELPRQGDHRLLAGSAAQAPGPEGHDPEARSVHQRRSRHDEPVRARRGVRHRRRRRDRPRPRSLRALHRREPLPQLERHHRIDLPGRPRRGAPRRLPRQHRPGHPPHHGRDQAAHPSPGHRRGRRRHHRGGRHRRRHRDPALPRGHPAVPQGGRAGQRLLRARHAGAVHRSVRGAEDQAHPALRDGAAQPGIQPDVIVCRSSEPISDSLKRKISNLCDVEERAVVNAADARNIYELPLILHDEGLDDVVCDVLRLDAADRPRTVGGRGGAGRGGRAAGPHRADRQVRRPARRLPLGGREPAPRRLPPRGQGRDRLDPGRGRRGAPRRGTAVGPRRDGDPRRVRGAGHRGEDRRCHLRPRARHPLPRPVPGAAGHDHRVRPQRARSDGRQLQ